MVVVVTIVALLLAAVQAEYKWKGLDGYDPPNFLCKNFDVLCENFLELINCGSNSTDFVKNGCPGYPEVSNDIEHFVGQCTCKSPVYASAAGTRIANQLISNRVGPEMSWILEPWQSGPPYDYRQSYKVVCELALERLGCPSSSQTIVASGVGPSSVYRCRCGTFTTPDTAIQNLIIDQINKQPLSTMPIFEDPVYLSTALTICMVLIMGKLGAIVAVYFKLPAIIGYILIGIGIQNFLSPMILKGPGFPYPSFSSEAKTFALVIVLLRAGLAIELDAIRREWVANICLSCIPYMCEFFAFCFVGVKLFGWNSIEMGLFSSMISALSPSLIIPFMINLLASTKYDYGYIPRLILISTPIEAVIAVLLFSIFAILNQSTADPLYPWVKVYPLYANVLLIPLNIIFSCAMGTLVGFGVSKYINYRVTQKNEFLWSKINKNLQMGSSTADLVFVMVVASYTMMCLCTKQYIQQSSGVLVVFTIACAVQKFCDKKIGKDLADALKGIWVFAEVFLFTFVGTNLSLDNSNGPLIGQRGMSGSTFGDLISCLLAGTAARGIGHVIILPLIAMSFPPHRKNFAWLSNFTLSCFIAQLPKASVQATLGGAAYAQHLIPGLYGVNRAFIILQCSAITILLYAAIGSLLSVFVAYPMFLKASKWDTEAGWDNKTNKYLPGSQYYVAVPGEEEAPPQADDYEVDLKDEDDNSAGREKRSHSLSASGYIVPEDNGSAPDSFYDMLGRVTAVVTGNPTTSDDNGATPGEPRRRSLSHDVIFVLTGQGKSGDDHHTSPAATTENVPPIPPATIVATEEEGATKSL